MKIKYLKTSKLTKHVSKYALEGIEFALHKNGIYGCESHLDRGCFAIFAKTLVKLGLLKNIKKHKTIVIPMMNLNAYYLFPWAYTHKIVPFVFDCLPAHRLSWVDLFRRCAIDEAFFTATDAVLYFNKMLPGGKWHWMPEAINTKNIKPAIPWEHRKIDVLEFGRRFEKYHNAIVDGLSDCKFHHLYEKNKGEIIFQGKDDFYHGLSDSKISICFPQSVTHPERFSGMETLTQRYLESMASGCLLVGKCPGELLEFAGYDPVVPVDWSAPYEQLKYLIDKPSEHYLLREKNIEFARNQGSWDWRACQILNTLNI